MSRSRVWGAYKLASRRYPLSVKYERGEDVAKIARHIARLQPDHEEFLIVHGPKGVGKSTALRTALEHDYGVSYVSVKPNSDPVEILSQESSKLMHHH